MKVDAVRKQHRAFRKKRLEVTPTRLPAGQAQRSQVGFWPRHWQPDVPILVPLAQTGKICPQLTRFSSRASSAALASASGSAMAAAKAPTERSERMVRNFMMIA